MLEFKKTFKFIFFSKNEFSYFYFHQRLFVRSMYHQVLFYNSIEWNVQNYKKKIKKNFSFFYFFEKFKKIKISNKKTKQVILCFVSHTYQFYFIIGCVVSVGLRGAKITILYSDLNCLNNIEVYLFKNNIYSGAFCLIKTHNCFSVGDIIVCKTNKQIGCTIISTANVNLGVLVSAGTCDYFLIPDSNYEMKLHCNLKKKPRKVSSLSLW